jgi:hypothetical protein
MAADDSRREQLLALALGSRRKRDERRALPDRRSGLDRRRARLDVPFERRVGERRQTVRRKVDQAEGPTLLQKARSRLGGRLRRDAGTEDHAGDELR